MKEQNPAPTLEVLRKFVTHTQSIQFGNLSRPRVRSSEPATRELIDWGIKFYCYPWLRHMTTLANGTVILLDAGNSPSARIVGRSIYELGAHAYYVAKHVKQHLGAKNLDAVWKFLLPVHSGSRFLNDIAPPEESEIFPAPVHIKKVTNCFKEFLPKEAGESYSFFSEYCHPTMLVFKQYYRWANPCEVTFVDRDSGRWTYAAEAACMMGMLQIKELLKLSNEKPVSAALVKIIRAVAKTARETDPKKKA